MFGRTWPVSVLLIGLGMWSPAAALADVNNTAQVAISPSFSGGTGPYSQTVTQPGLIDISGSATGGLGSSGDASTRVDYGVTKLRGVSSGALSSVGHGIFRDALTITAPGIATGTPGTLTFSVRVEGAVGASNGFSAGTWGLQADLGGGAYDINKSGHFNSPEVVPSGYSGDPPGVYSATISFQFGIPMPLTAELSASAGAGYGNSGAGAADYNMSMYWAGIQDVKANGSPVGSFDASSDSGTDWSHARCPADFNGDGFVDGIDYDQFNNAFENPDPAQQMAADFNGDGFVDGIDYDLFNAAFEGGC